MVLINMHIEYCNITSWGKFPVIVSNTQVMYENVALFLYSTVIGNRLYESPPGEWSHILVVKLQLTPNTQPLSYLPKRDALYMFMFFQILSECQHRQLGCMLLK